MREGTERFLANPMTPPINDKHPTVKAGISDWRKMRKAQGRQKQLQTTHHDYYGELGGGGGQFEAGLKWTLRECARL